MNQNSMTTLPLSATDGAVPITDAVLAMAYVPMQEYNMVYDVEDALQMGTLFPNLDKPFLGEKGCNL